MITYEFEAEIKDGMIRIPEDFKESRSEKFRIIIVSEEKKDDSIRKALLNAPVWSEQDVRDFNENILKGYRNWIPEEL